MAAAKKTFSTAAHTRPTADDDIAPVAAAVAQPVAQPVAPALVDVKTSRRPDVTKAKRTAVVEPAASDPATTALTWRQTPDQVDQLEDLVKRLRRQLGRRLTKATVLDALVQLATDSDEVRASIIDRLRKSA